MPKQVPTGRKPPQRGASPVRASPVRAAPKSKFPPVPPKFNPLEAKPEDLLKYGLPARPDYVTQPNLLAAWKRIFAQPATFVQAIFARDPIEVLPAPPPNAHSMVLSTRIEDSQNWSGAMVVPDGGNQIVQIFGEWTVPRPDLPAFSDDLGPAGQANDYDCSTWIGLDGDRRYLDSTMPQVGTAQVLHVGANGTATPEYYAWFEWWARYPVKLLRRRLKHFLINSEMSVMAMIAVMDSQNVAVIFRTFAGSASQITLFFRPIPDVFVDASKMTQVTPHISGATAEWIMERPHTPGAPPTVFDLFPSYTGTQFSYCVAGMAPQPGVATSEKILTSPRLLRIYEVPPNPPSRVRLVSMPKLRSTTSLQVDYGGFH
jgi:hypothetical protein